MENGGDANANFVWLLNNSINNNPAAAAGPLSAPLPRPPSPSTLVNHQPSFFQNFIMPENPPNGGFSLPPANHLLRQEPNYTLLDPYHPQLVNPSFDLLEDFGRLNLSSTPHSPFLAPSDGGVVNNSMVGANSSMIRDFGDFGRVKFESNMSGQIGLSNDRLDNYFDFDQFDRRRNPSIRPPRNGFQPYNDFPLENPTKCVGRYSRDAYVSSFHMNGNGNGSFYMSGNGNSNGNGSFYMSGNGNSNGNGSFYRSGNGNSNGNGNGNGSFYMSGNGSVYQSRLRPKFPASSSLEEMKGNVLYLAMDQNGCRFLQKKFEERKPEDIDLIFSEVKTHIRQLMIHQFGNYLIQKFFDVCDQAKITEILASVVSHEQTFVKICLDIHGTRAMQKLLEKLTTPEQRTLVVSLLQRVTVTVPLIKSIHGHHVIQHCLKCFHGEEISTFLRLVADYCVPIATDKSGCCVLQQCIARAGPENQERLVSEITENAVFLSHDPYGNYVVQFVVDMGVPHYTAGILAALAGSFVPLSMDKYGSNVVEKCIKDCDEKQSSKVIHEIVYSPNFLMVIQNAYGNYVTQSAWEFSKGRLHDKVSDLIQKYYPFLHSHPHGKRALARTKGSKQQQQLPMFRRV